MKTSEKINEVTKAMSELQGRLSTISKDKKAYNYKYADLASIWEDFRPFLVELGLFIFQDVLTDESGVKVSTRINHISGQWIESEYITIPISKRDAHAVGSAVTYGRRYSLSACIGIVTDEDDDGAKAREPGEGRPIKKKAEQPKVDNTPITKKQLEELEYYLEGNDEMREGILDYMTGKFKVDTLDKMPAHFYAYTLKKARDKHAELNKAGA